MEQTSVLLQKQDFCSVLSVSVFEIFNHKIPANFLPSLISIKYNKTMTVISEIVLNKWIYLDTCFKMDVCYLCWYFANAKRLRRGGVPME